MLHIFCFWHGIESAAWVCEKWKQNLNVNTSKRGERNSMKMKEVRPYRSKMKDKRKKRDRIKRQWHKRRANNMNRDRGMKRVRSLELHRYEWLSATNLKRETIRKWYVCSHVYWNGSLSIVYFWLLVCVYVYVYVCALSMVVRASVCACIWEWLFQRCMFTCIFFILIY